jgi:hypothetical protein
MPAVPIAGGHGFESRQIRRLDLARTRAEMIYSSSADRKSV